MQSNLECPSSEFVELESCLQAAESHRSKDNVSALKDYVSQTPTLGKKARALSEEMEEKLLFYIASGDATKKAQLKLEVEQLRTQLLGHGDCHIAEQLLANEIALSLILMRYCDTRLVRHFNHSSSTETRKMDAIHSRLMRSLKTYAAVKRAIPDFAINLSQVNIGV